MWFSVMVGEGFWQMEMGSEKNAGWRKKSEQRNQGEFGDVNNKSCYEEHINSNSVKTLEIHLWIPETGEGESLICLN